ncbi:hypothetical protein BASA81_014073 [Batrachochytrium salamandrivorans]|nr:hypothetical protein BASA62_000994 [Batrachochytrium salamandrivorans]KAH9248271.1 hypothetical protein BASA81_014073 [Batrachochytrium salamandrivorans]
MPASVLVNHVRVKFPYEPYPQQHRLMQTIVGALQKSENALVESPTGTGKTVCLLCSTLAWQDAFMCWRKEAMRPSVERNSAMLDTLSLEVFGSLHSGQIIELVLLPCCVERLLAQVSVMLKWQIPSAFAPISNLLTDDRPITKPPQILYASRTHSQLSQAIAELRSTAYKNAVSIVIGSRDQMCINPAVAEAKSALRTGLCRSKVKKGSCSFHAESEAPNNRAASTASILDIEELVVFGKERKACPYYLSKAAQPRADIIFLPYNYLINRNSRTSQSFSLDNAIVILDEGHNMESSCNDATSFEISTDDIVSSIQEIDQCIKILQSHKPKHHEYIENVDLDDVAILKELLESLYRKVLTQMSDSKKTSRELPGSYITELFEPLEINGVLQCFDGKTVDHCIMTLSSDQSSLKRSSRLSLSIFKNALQIATHIGKDNMDVFSHYMVYINYAKEQFGDKSGDVGYKKGIDSGENIILHFWCFNSGVAMQELQNMNVRSIVIASGTLSPLDGFAAEMGIGFPHRLENSHVIDPSQVYIGVVTKGPRNNALSTSYKSRQDNNIALEFGLALINFARIVPDGMLVFFTSYSVMNSCIMLWKQPQGGIHSKSIWETLISLKYPFIESRHQQEFSGSMKRFEDRIEQRLSPAPMFMAICRGRVSEGIDFSDRKGRAVVIYGIPYPALMDPAVKLKQKYLDSTFSKSAARMTGGEWYEQQASRSVNQAIGRVIRHKNDYGAILLCDERFHGPKYTKNLPLWLRSNVQAPKDFKGSEKRLIQFFKDASERENSILKNTNTMVNRQDQSLPTHAHDSLSRAAGCIRAQKIIPATSNGLRHDAMPLNRMSSLSSQTKSGALYDPLRDPARFGTHSASGATKRQHQQIYDPLSDPIHLNLNRSKGLSNHYTIEQRVAATIYPTRQRSLPNVISTLFPNQNDTTSLSQLPQSACSEQLKPLIPTVPTAPMLDRQQKQMEGSPTPLDPKQYMSILSKTVPKEIYRRFKQILLDYRQKVTPIHVLVTSILALFIDDLNQCVSLEKCIMLAKEFRVFIGSRHYAMYDSALTLKITKKNAPVS